MFCCFINIELVAHTTNSYLNEACLIRFSVMGHHILLVLRNMRPHFSTILGGIVNSEITPKKYKNVKMTLNRLNRTFVYIVRAETRRQSVSLFIVSWDM